MVKAADQGAESGRLSDHRRPSGQRR